MEINRKKHLDWVRAILEELDVRPTTLARTAGVDPSTLSKFLNNKTGTARLNTYTIEKLEKLTRIKPFETAFGRQ